MKKTKKARAFKLFSQGYLPLSPEVKALGLHPSNRYKYYYEWEALGKPTGGTQSRHSQPAMVSTKSPGGETIGGIDETKAKAKPKPKPVEALSQEEQMPEGVEEDIGPEEPAQVEYIGGVDETKVRGKKKDGEWKDKYEVTVADEGIKCTIYLSLQTLVLYQIAAAKHAQLSINGEAKLTLGDFLDTCVEDFFRARGLKLGLVEL